MILINKFMKKKSDLPESTDTADREFFVMPQESTEAEPTPATVGEEWIGDDEQYAGQLAIDVYQTPTDIVIKSAIAGVRAEDIDITLNNDTVTIKGIRRQNSTIDDDDFFYRECYWGGFSRSVILPVDVKGDGVRASLENGILTVILPKAEEERARSIAVKEIAEPSTPKRSRKKEPKTV